MGKIKSLNQVWLYAILVGIAGATVGLLWLLDRA